MKLFLTYYLGILLRPQRTFNVLSADEHRLQYGFVALVLNAILYTMVYVLLTLGGGAPSSFTPWLPIPKEDYYFYNQFMLAPSMFLAWIGAAAVAQLLSRLFSGNGSFEDTLAVLGLAISIACLPSLLHDLPDSFLGAIGVIDQREYEIALNSPTIWRTILLTLYAISILWFGILFVKGIESAQKIKNAAATFVGITSYCVYQGIFLIFNR